MRATEILIQIAGLYLGCGLLFAIAFVISGIDKLDAQAHGSGLGFRLLLLPGSAALWPWLLRRWMKGERTA